MSVVWKLTDVAFQYLFPSFFIYNLVSAFFQIFIFNQAQKRSLLLKASYSPLLWCPFHQICQSSISWLCLSPIKNIILMMTTVFPLGAKKPRYLSINEQIKFKWPELPSLHLQRQWHDDSLIEERWKDERIKELL